jgi:hypothetical protein
MNELQGTSAVPVAIGPAATSQPDISSDPIRTARPEPVLTDRQAALVDVRQGQLMTRDSVDGRPPSHRTRTIEWRVLIVVLSLSVVGAAVWALLRGVSSGGMLDFSVGFLLLLIFGSWPVWMAGLRRGEEEAVARASAIVEVVPEIEQAR